MDVPESPVDGITWNTMPSDGLLGIAFALSYASTRLPGEVSCESFRVLIRLRFDLRPRLVADEATDASSGGSGDSLTCRCSERSSETKFGFAERPC